jgi:hypothetical protein
MHCAARPSWPRIVSHSHDCPRLQPFHTPPPSALSPGSLGVWVEAKADWAFNWIHIKLLINLRFNWGMDSGRYFTYTRTLATIKGHQERPLGHFSLSQGSSSTPFATAPASRFPRPIKALSSTAGTRWRCWSTPHREPATREASHWWWTEKRKLHHRQPSPSSIALSRWAKQVALLPRSVLSQSPSRFGHRSAFPPALAKFRSWRHRVLSRTTATLVVSFGHVHRAICGPD